MEGNSAPSPNSPIIIRPINKGVVHRICAGQVILDLPSAVKELVENSLDAGATSIEISLKDYGQESFQVVDNGCGISPNNFKVLALKHHTSKLADFHDLQSLTTFGFRGEALSSLCALGDLTIETRTKNETVATHLTYDHSGLLTAERKTARQIGTTVTVNKLFSSLPVRSKEFHRNIRKEYGKLITLLNAYALIARGVRLVCTNTTGRSMKSVVLKTQGSGSLKDNIITVFGMSTFNCLEPLDICISETCKVNGFLSKPGYGSGRNLGDRQFFFVNDRPVDMPKVSKLVNELYKGANSRQYPIAIMSFSLPTMLCDVNVTPDKRKIFFSDEGSILQSLREALAKIYSPNHASYSVNRFVELNKEETPKLCSGNERSELLKHLSPDNSHPRKELHDKDHAGVLPAAVNEGIGGSSTIQLINGENGFQKKQNSILKLQDAKKVNILSGSHSKQIKNHLSTAATDKQSPVPPGAVSHSSIVQSSLAKFVTVTKRKHEDIITTLSEVPLLRNGPIQCQSKKTNTEMHSASSTSPINCPMVEDCDKTNNGEPQLSYCFRTEEVLDVSEIPFTSEGNKNDPESGKVEQCHAEKLKIQESKMSIESDLAASPCKNLENVSEDTMVAAPQLFDIPSDASMLSPGLKIGFTLQFSLKDLKTRRQQRLSRFPSCRHTQGRMNIKGFGCYAAATLDLCQPENEEGKARALVAATRELERLFKKEDFGKMKVIGQFNLGFIIGKIDQDLFIVDQHAADEKYNFERLSQSTILNQQPLLRPLMMELSPEEEIVVSMHMGIIRRNGFSLEEDVLAPPGQRFRLKAVPFSKNITFGVEDVKELISILADSQGECSMVCSYKMDSSDSVCPPRVRAMLASRACRSSVMIGDSLGRNEMQKILEHLADLRSPWNCPHGRPTMRHLVDLGTVCRRIDEDDTV